MPALQLCLNGQSGGQKHHPPYLRSGSWVYLNQNLGQMLVPDDLFGETWPLNACIPHQGLAKWPCPVIHFVFSAHADHCRDAPFFSIHPVCLLPRFLLSQYETESIKKSVCPPMHNSQGIDLRLQVSMPHRPRCPNPNMPSPLINPFRYPFIDELSIHNVCHIPHTFVACKTFRIALNPALLVGSRSSIGIQMTKCITACLRPSSYQLR